MIYNFLRDPKCLIVYMCVYFLRNVPTMTLTFEEFNELWLDINQVLLQDQVASKSIVSARYW